MDQVKSWKSPYLKICLLLIYMCGTFELQISVSSVYGGQMNTPIKSL